MDEEEEEEEEDAGVFGFGRGGLDVGICVFRVGEAFFEPSTTREGDGAPGGHATHDFFNSAFDGLRIREHHNSAQLCRHSAAGGCAFSHDEFLARPPSRARSTRTSPRAGRSAPSSIGSAMASKIGKQQRRKRYAETGVVFTDAFRARVEALPGAAADARDATGTAAAVRLGDADAADALAGPAGAFKREMRRFVALGSTYAEIETVDAVIAALVDLARASDPEGGEEERGGGAGDDDRSASSRVVRDVAASETNRRRRESAAAAEPSPSEPSASAPAPVSPATSLPVFHDAARVFLGMLFLANSRPLHRHLVACIRRFPTQLSRAGAEAALLAECRAALKASARRHSSRPQPAAERLRPLAALASVDGCHPKTDAQRRVLRGVAVDAAAVVAEGAGPPPPRFFLLPSRNKTRRGAPFPGPFSSRALFRALPPLEGDEYSFTKAGITISSRNVWGYGARPSGRCCERVTLIRTERRSERERESFFSSSLVPLSRARA